MWALIDWYKEENKHSAIKFVQPKHRHNELDKTILKNIK